VSTFLNIASRFCLPGLLSILTTDIKPTHKKTGKETFAD